MIAQRLLADQPVAEMDSLTANSDDRDFEVVAEHVREAIEKNQPEGALDRLHTFVIKFIRIACEPHGIEVNRDKALHSIFGEYVKALREGLIAHGVDAVKGILNGTCNYILTRMEATGQGYNVLFDECAKLGYLEADPNLDVGGIDAGHKLSLLSSIAFGTQVSFDAVELEGIQNVSLDDIGLARDMGYRIKLLGVAQMTGRGLEQRMTPCLVPADSPLGQLQGGTNMVVLEGDAVGQIVLRGAGAGAGPTASAVLSDICDIARGHRGAVFGQPAKTLTAATPALSQRPAPYYIRMAITDKPGALAKVAAVLGEAGVSIDRMRQYGHVNDSAPVLIVTHKTTRADIDHALAAFGATSVVAGEPVALRIEEV